MWRALYLSFYSKSLYREVAHSWRGTGLSYLGLLLLLYCVPLTLISYFGFVHYLEGSGKELISKLPVMTFEKGRLSIPQDQPYVVYESDSDSYAPRPILIFDNTGTHTLEDLDQGQALITDRFLHLRGSRDEIRTMEFKDMPDTILGHEEIQDVVRIAQRWFMPAFFLTLYAIFYIMRFIQVLIYGALGLLLSKIMNTYLEYPQLVRIATMALTPVIVVDTLLLLFLPGVHWGWLGFLLAMGYLAFGIRANRELIS